MFFCNSGFICNKLFGCLDIDSSNLKNIIAGDLFDSSMFLIGEESIFFVIQSLVLFANCISNIGFCEKCYMNNEEYIILICTQYRGLPGFIRTF